MGEAGPGEAGTGEAESCEAGGVATGTEPPGDGDMAGFGGGDDAETTGGLGSDGVV